MLYNLLKSSMLQHANQLLSDGKRTLTYAHFLKTAEEYGRRLHQEIYGLLFESDLDTAIALFACFFARKTAVLLSKRYGEKHTEKIIQKIGLSHLLTDTGIQKIGDYLNRSEELSDVAVILCTSGTTGAPKGAMITQDNLITNLQDISLYFDLNHTDHITIARPLYHCAVLTGELLISLLKGARIIFTAGGFSPAYLLGKLRDTQSTVLCGTPTMLYHLASLNHKSDRKVTLKKIVVSGECMTLPAAQRIREGFETAQIYHVYGLTEASPRVCYLPPEEFDEHPLSVGYPLASLQVQIIEGELVVSGNSIMKGYYNDLAATEKVIRKGILHTGDIAERDEDGRIYIKCRKDNLIIRAGMNIYPQEIEESLKKDPRIKDVLAYGAKGDIVSEKIHLKVVTELTKQEVYAVCKEMLPEHQYPHAIHLVDEIPKNASGKVVRHATSI